MDDNRIVFADHYSSFGESLQMLIDLTEIFSAAGIGSLAAVTAINVFSPCFVFPLLGDGIYHELNKVQ